MTACEDWQLYNNIWSHSSYNAMNTVVLNFLFVCSQKNATIDNSWKFTFLLFLSSHDPSNFFTELPTNECAWCTTTTTTIIIFNVHNIIVCNNELNHSALPLYLCNTWGARSRILVKVYSIFGHVSVYIYIYMSVSQCYWRWRLLSIRSPHLFTPIHLPYPTLTLSLSLRLSLSLSVFH